MDSRNLFDSDKIFADALKRCRKMQDAHLAETEQSLVPIRPQHQQRMGHRSGSVIAPVEAAAAAAVRSIAGRPRVGEMYLEIKPWLQKNGFVENGKRTRTLNTRKAAAGKLFG